MSFRRSHEMDSRWFAILLAAFLVVLVGTGAIWAWSFKGPSPEDLAAGKDLFEHEYSVNDARCGDGDGLGPVFNQRSCVACHFLGGVGGAGPNDHNVTAYEAFPVPGRTDIRGGVIHRFAVEKVFLESTDQLRSIFPVIPDAIRASDGCATIVQDFDPLQIEEINTPALFGAGVIDDLSDTALGIHAAKRSIGRVSREFGGDFSGTGVGRLRIRGGRTGKFGWKGQFATLEEFVATACAMELGLTNPMVSQPIPISGGRDDEAELDMTKKELYQLVAFVKNLPRPQQVIPTDSRARDATLLGEQLFSSIGCADCHLPELGGVQGIYSDFHLYEVEHEKDTQDYIEPEFDPKFTLPSDHPRPSEWQTPPLWGVADSAPYFHDGKSPTLLAAIKRHGRDARAARQQFEQLSPPEKQAVVAFLQSLRAPGAN